MPGGVDFPHGYFSTRTQISVDCGGGGEGRGGGKVKVHGFGRLGTSF